MKKSIIYLGVALITATGVMSASSHYPITNTRYQIESSETPSPMSIAICKGDLDSVKKFVEYGANVNSWSNGMTPLMIAARYNKVEIIKFLLANGAIRNAKSENGLTALKYAELSKANEAIEILKQ